MQSFKEKKPFSLATYRKSLNILMQLLPVGHLSKDMSLSPFYAAFLPNVSSKTCLFVLTFQLLCILHCTIDGALQALPACVEIPLFQRGFVFTSDSHPGVLPV